MSDTDRSYVTITQKAEFMQEMVAAWVEREDLDLEKIDPDDHTRPGGVWIGEEPEGALAWAVHQADQQGVDLFGGGGDD